MIQELSLVIGVDKSRPLTEKLRAAPLELSLFDGAFNHNLSTKIQEILEASFNYEFMCKAILKCIWWAVYYKIWLTRCQETIQQERLLGITPKLKRVYTKTTHPSTTPKSKALKFGISLAQDQACWKSTLTD
jgi:hypothetical protein